MRVSDFVGTYIWLLLAALVGAAVLFWGWLKQAGQRERFDRWVLQLPGLGPIARKFATSQAVRTLATLFRGVHADPAHPELQNAGQQVREGRALSAAMTESGAFTDVAIKMVEVGESTGALQEMLNSLAEFYDEEIDTNLGRFITLVEPILLVVMGIIIAGLLLSLYMPLFNMSGLNQ